MHKSSSVIFFFVSLLTGLGAGLFSAPAHAADTSVAVLGIEASEGVPESVATATTDALRQRMSLTPGYRLVQGRDLVEVKLVFSCPDEAPPCMGQAAKSLGAARLLFGSVKKVGPDAFSVTIKLLDSEKASVESWTTDQFTRPQATAAGLRGPAQKWIATLTGQSLPGTLNIQGGVVGAQVAVDDVGVGVLSAKGLGISGVAPGQHEISVSKPGYQTVKQTITLASGDTRDLTIDMVADPRGGGTAVTTTELTTEPAPDSATSAPASSGNRLGTKIAAVATAVAGVVGIVVGIRYSLLIKEANDKLDPFRRFDCVLPTRGPANGCDINNQLAPPPTEKQYEWMQKTKDSADRFQIYQWIGYGAGGALLVTSAILFYRGFISSPSSSSLADARGPSLHLAPMLTPTSMGAAAVATF